MPNTSGSIGLVEPVNPPYFEVSFPEMFVGDCVDVDQAFPGLFATDSYEFGALSGNVLLSYWDGTEIWVSFPDGQQNASFEITASEPQDTPFGIYQKVTGRASCRVFNFAGESKKMEDVKFVMSFSKD
ncbi:MAG: hypothetical protein ACKVUS_12785 [Saprospiraceae bacterium]